MVNIALWSSWLRYILYFISAMIWRTWVVVSLFPFSRWGSRGTGTPWKFCKDTGSILAHSNLDTLARESMFLSMPYCTEQSQDLLTAVFKAGCVWEERWAEGQKRHSKLVLLLDNCANREHSIILNSSASYLCYINAANLVERPLTVSGRSTLSTGPGVRH